MESPEGTHAEAAQGASSAMAGAAAADQGPTPRDSSASPSPRPQRAPPLLLVTTVDIGEGRSDRIEVRQGDVPLQVAAAFVAKHALPPAVVPRLAMHLEENLLKVEESQRRPGGAEPSAAAGAAAAADGDAGDGVEVFHRLYQQAITLREKMEMRRNMVQRSEAEELASSKTSMSWISAEMMRERSAGPFGNYGEMLYAEGQESAARRADKAARLRAQREQDEVAGVTFRPEISRAAQCMWGGFQDCGSVPAWQRLSKTKASKAQERLAMLRRERDDAEVAECTFTPSISGRSERLMTGRSAALRSANVSAHEHLYQDALRRHQKQAEYAHWCPEDATFQPKLNESAMSREFLRRSLQKDESGSSSLTLPGASPREARHMALVARLYASYEKLQAKLAEARSSLEGGVDAATGRRMFHPETGRAPRHGARSTGRPVSEYLYSLGHLQDEKLRAAAAERERRAREDAASSKAAQGSRVLVRQLQHKRFKQVFEFLDADGLGCVDLVALVGEAPAWLDDLDDEVRADLEAAARLLQRRALKHTDSAGSGSSAATSCFMMPPPPGADVAHAAGGTSPRASPAATPGSASTPAPLTLRAFCGVMEEVVSAGRRGAPRAYLAPSPPRKALPQESHVPVINARSKVLASRVRPKDTPAYEVLYAESSAMSAKRDERRAEAEAAASRDCPFAPTLLSKQLVREGRVMKAVREGSWWGKPSGAAAGHDSDEDGNDEEADGLDSAGSLQQLASSLMAGDAPPPQQQQQQQPRQQPQQQQQQQQRGKAPRAAPPAAGRGSRSASSSPSKALRSSASSRTASPTKAGVAGPSGSSSQGLGAERGFASAEEEAQFHELEQEVAEMQRMLDEATAAAVAVGGDAAVAAQPGRAEYLSRILGLAQEQVDALAPAISALHRGGGGGGGGAAGGLQQEECRLQQEEGASGDGPLPGAHAGTADGAAASPPAPAPASAQRSAAANRTNSVSSRRSGCVGGAAAATATTTTPSRASSFKVNEDGSPAAGTSSARGSSSSSSSSTDRSGSYSKRAAAAAAAAAAGAGAGGSLSGASAGQLTSAVKEALQELHAAVGSGDDPAAGAISSAANSSSSKALRSTSGSYAAAAARGDAARTSSSSKSLSHRAGSAGGSSHLIAAGKLTGGGSGGNDAEAADAAPDLFELAAAPVSGQDSVVGGGSSGVGGDGAAAAASLAELAAAVDGMLLS